MEEDSPDEVEAGCGEVDPGVEAVPLRDGNGEAVGVAGARLRAAVQRLWREEAVVRAGGKFSIIQWFLVSASTTSGPTRESRDYSENMKEGNTSCGELGAAAVNYQDGQGMFVLKKGVDFGIYVVWVWDQFVNIEDWYWSLGLIAKVFKRKNYSIDKNLILKIKFVVALNYFLIAIYLKDPTCTVAAEESEICWWDHHLAWVRGIAGSEEFPQILMSELLKICIVLRIFCWDWKLLESPILEIVKKSGAF